MSLSVLRRIVSEELQVGLAGAGRQAQALRTALFNRLSTEPRWGRYTSTESLTRRLTQEAYKMSEWYDAVNSLRETDGPADDVLAQLGAIVEDVAVSWMRNRDKVSKRDVRLGESSQLAQEKNMLTEQKLRKIIRHVITEHANLFESWSPIEGFEYSPEMEEFCQMISDFIDANGVPDRDERVETHADHDDTPTMRTVFKYNGKRMSFGGGVRNNTLIFVRYR